MALPPARLPQRAARRDHPGAHLRGEEPLREDDRLRVDLRLSLAEAQRLHDLLRDALEESPDAPGGRLLSLLSWRILAASGGTGLTGRLAELARQSATLEEFEAARQGELGPILDALERQGNRDP